MKKKALSLALALVLCLGLSVPALADNMNKTGEWNTVSAGHSNTAAVDPGGALWMWGWNGYGQLGNGSNTDSAVPVKVLDNTMSVSCGHGHTAALKADGSLWAWGLNDSGQIGNNGGKNASYSESSVQNVPVKVMDSVAVVSCGLNHTAAVKKDGSLWMWGFNGNGELGNGGGGNKKLTDGSSCQTVPLKVLDGVATVSCGHSHTAALKTDGTLWMWGNNRTGQLGNGGVGNERYNGEPIQNTPVKVLDNVTAVSSGVNFTAAIRADGSLWMWGYNGNGQLCNNSLENSLVPVKVMDGVASVSCGSGHIAVIKTDGSLWTWGTNDCGELGIGSITNSATPTKIMDQAAQVRCGWFHTVAVKTDGSIWTWGNNRGQLGNGGGGNATCFYGDCQTLPIKLALTAAVNTIPQQPAGNATASPTNDKLEVNGAAADPTVYKIGGSNYFKIRDVAALLNGTEKQFAVGYDGALSSVTATTGQGYAKLDGDLAGAATGGDQTAAVSNDTIYVDGQKVEAEVYKINGSNYFKLRDLGRALNFYVGWSAQRGMYIETGKPYSE